jgi:hypothetical protein
LGFNDFTKENLHTPPLTFCSLYRCGSISTFPSSETSSEDCNNDVLLLRLFFLPLVLATSHFNTVGIGEYKCMAVVAMEVEVVGGCEIHDDKIDGGDGCSNGIVR